MFVSKIQTIIILLLFLLIIFSINFNYGNPLYETFSTELILPLNYKNIDINDNIKYTQFKHFNSNILSRHLKNIEDDCPLFFGFLF